MRRRFKHTPNRRMLLCKSFHCLVLCVRSELTFAHMFEVLAIARDLDDPELAPLWKKEAEHESLELLLLFFMWLRTCHVRVATSSLSLKFCERDFASGPCCPH